MARALNPLLNALWTARYGRVGVKPRGIGATLKGLVSRRGWRAPPIPLTGVQNVRGQGNASKFHDKFRSLGMEPKTMHDWLKSEGFRPKQASAELSPQIGPDPEQAPPAKPTYMTPDWMGRTADVLKTNPDAARKWFLGSVAGLARKKGLRYHIMAQEPGSDEIIQGGELDLEQALEILRRRKSLDGQFNPEAVKAAEWVHPDVQQQHALKHAPEMGLDPEQYNQLSELVSKMKRRKVNRRKNPKGETTEGFDVRGFRLVTDPQGRIVSLYQKAAAFGLALPEYLGAHGAHDLLEQFKAPQVETEPDQEEYEDFEDVGDVPTATPLSESQLEQIRQYLMGTKTAQEGFSTWVDPDLSENHEYQVLKQDGKVTAYIRIQPWANGHFLSNFWVQKAERGKGHGKKLMNHVIERLGKKQLFLKAEPFDGSPFDLKGLKAYYKKFGFIDGREDLMRRPADKREK